LPSELQITTAYQLSYTYSYVLVMELSVISVSCLQNFRSPQLIS